MSYTFRVVFDGVCAYVPEHPFFDRCEDADGDYWKAWDNREKPICSMAVLLPDLRRPVRPNVPDNLPLNFPKFRDSHFPLLKFRLGDLREGTTRRVDLVARDISVLDEDGVLFLRREQIRLTVDCENAKAFTYSKWAPTPAQQRDLCEKIGKVPELGDRQQLDSLWWLPALDQIVDSPGEAAKVREDVLPSFRGPFPADLVARVECLGGHLRTFDFNRGMDGNPIAWRFAKPAEGDHPGSWNRAIGNALALEFYDVRNEVRIELRRLANDVVVRHLVLAPAPGASRPVLEISISNREPELLFEEDGFNRLILPDVDFQAFYENLSQVDPGVVQDLPIPNPAKGSLFGVREKPCAGAVMNG